MSAEVLSGLRQQNERWGTSTARAENLEALGRPNTVVVATGQQVGLFLGPLYTLYKAATAVRVARQLTEETGVSAVPLFWLQTEDHDHPEVATAHVPRSDGSHLALTAGSSQSERTSMAQRTFEADLEAALEGLANELGNLPHAEDHLARIRRHYTVGAGWSTAFAKVVAELFADVGLVILDPRDPVFAAATGPLHRAALTKVTEIADGLTERVRALEAAEFGVPIHIRPGAPLSFFHPEGPQGPRYRLRPADEGYALVGDETRTFDKDTLLDRIESSPLSFSTSALLRPVLQDTLLPTAAYVGGPGEIDYFAQIEPLYRAYDLPVPLIVPRGHFRVVEPKVGARLERLGLDSGALSEPLEAVLAKASSAEASGPSPEAIASLLKTGFHDALAGVLPDLLAADKALQKAADKTGGTVEKAIDKLVDRYRSASLRKDESRVTEVRRLKALLFPEGVPQERFFTYDYFAARYGSSDFVQMVLDGYVPFTSDVVELRP